MPDRATGKGTTGENTATIAGDRILIDANVLFPTVLRGLVTGCAARGLFHPFWSARILEEWARAAGRHSPAGELQARSEIARLRARFPEAEIHAEATAPPDLESRLWLPDPADKHVLAAAISAGCGLILTWNLRDFPRHLLAAHGIAALDPDRFLLSLPRDPVAQVAQQELAQLQSLAGTGPGTDADSDAGWTLRRMLRKARLPRLARALG